VKAKLYQGGRRMWARDVAASKQNNTKIHPSILGILVQIRVVACQEYC
jgi:hypothetical protein